MIKNIQAGYYSLKSLEGAPNGYICLTYLGSQLEIQVRIDRNPEANVTLEGYFTGHFETTPKGPKLLNLSVGDKGKVCRGVGTFACSQCSQWADRDESIDFMLFNGNRPVLYAEVYTKPAPEEPEDGKDEQDAEENAPQELTENSEDLPEETLDETLEEALEETETPTDQLKAYFPKLNAFDPFNTTNPAYQWWLCRNTAEFHGLMADTEIVPGPLLYTALSSALVRFGHFLFGRYEEENESPQAGRVLYILGVPVSDNSPVPDQMNARWIPAQNKITGSFNYAGYWLYYFDSETKKTVRAIIRR